MIFFGASRAGCGLIGCVPLLVMAVLVSVVVFVLSGGHLIVFGV